MFSNLARLINIFFTMLLFVIIVALVIIYEYTKNLPSYEQIINYKPDLAINVYDDSGEYLSSIFRENRILLEHENIPQVIKNSIIAAEDKDFYSNPGIDINGITRSIFLNIYNYVTGSNKLAGGSTITQQIIKNICLSPEKTLKRKIQEARLALGLTKYLNKDQILERYINHIYLGNNTYGFAAAALGYFSKPIDEIAIHEAALLAALPQAPSRYDPTRHENLELLTGRRNWIISQMQKLNFITETEAAQASIEPILITRKSLVTQQPYGIEYVVDEIKKKVVSLCADQEDLIYQYGFNVYSTINPELQKFATHSLRNGLLNHEKANYAWKGPLDNFKTKEEYKKFLKNLSYSEIHPLKVGYVLSKEGNKIKLFTNDHEIEIKETNQKIIKNVKNGDVVLLFGDAESDFQIYQAPRLNGAIVVMDVNNGNILAMSGGFNYYKNQFNRATQAMRQSGSAFKPVIYLTALEMGYSPYSILMDEPISIFNGSEYWSPKNYDGTFRGAMTLRSALEQSRNLPAVHLTKAVGLNNVIKTAKKLGLLPENFNSVNYSIALGSEEVTLMNMVKAYSIIGNGGFNVDSNLIEYIKDANGKILWRRNKAKCENCSVNDNLEELNPIPPLVNEKRERLIEPGPAYQMISVMEGVITRGTARSIAYLGGHIAGKTGTSNDNKDVWFVGMSKNIAFGVYVGYDRPRSIGGRATGSSVAIPMIKYFLDKSKDYMDTSEFISVNDAKKLNINITGEVIAKPDGYYDPPAVTNISGSVDSPVENLVVINNANGPKRDAYVPKYNYEVDYGD